MQNGKKGRKWVKKGVREEGKEDVARKVRQGRRAGRRWKVGE